MLGTFVVKKCEFVAFEVVVLLELTQSLAKRAVTKKCPVCDEEIPVRLLERHADLEAERLDEIIAAIGSVDVLDDAEPDDGYVAAA